MKNLNRGHVRNRGLVAIVAVFVFVGAAAFAGIEASGAPEPQPELREVRDPRAVGVDVLTPDAVNPAVERLAAYTLGVMNDWPRALIPGADYASIAHDIAEASLEKPSSDPHADAVLLAALAYWEGARYSDYVDRGACNDESWRRYGVDIGPSHMSRFEDGDPRQMVASHRTNLWTAQELMHVGGDCDGSRAHTLWQIWPATDPSSPRYDVCRLDVISTSRRDAAFCALMIGRADPSLCSYTGEKPSLGCDKAELRFNFTVEALVKHPFKSFSSE